VSTPRGTRRQRQAEATKMEILFAARELFAERGYAATSMAAIAESAGAAVQTIYDSVGSKAALLAALTELIEQPVAEIWEQSQSTFDAKEMLTLAIRLTRTIIEQDGDILALLGNVAPTEQSAADALLEGKRRHINGASRWIEMMAERDMLTPKVTVKYAATTLSALTAWGVWRELTVDLGLTFDEAEAWITDSLVQLLLKDDHPSRTTADHP
jgi:TetR/AcrR family transcriptional regulator, regulator of cefoperazone and chloramphenicol sensitivity